MTVIPNFILKRLYVSGSLRLLTDGVAFDITNSIGPGILTKLNSIKVGGQVYPPEQIELRMEDKVMRAEEISEHNPAVFFLNQRGTCVIRGASLEPGAHTITVDLLSKEAGKIVISIQDQLSA